MSPLHVLLYLLLVFLSVLAYLLIRLLPPELPSLRIVYKTIWRDLRAGWNYLRIQIFMYQCLLGNRSVVEQFKSVVDKHPDKVCFLYEDEKWTFQQVEDYSNCVANVFIKAGYCKGDEVALFMQNCPQFICIWLGLAKVGIVPALFNTNLRLKSLAHSANVVSTKAIIFDPDLASAVREAVPLLDNKDVIEFYCLGDTDNSCGGFQVKPLVSLIQSAANDYPSDKKNHPGFHDKLFYIYTSGTTGLPKAAVVKHCRYLFMGVSFKLFVGVKDTDVLYNTLPLYHSAGGGLGTSCPVMFGVTMAIRKKFSARNFWKDAIKYRATVALYIGEICRFLLNQPVTAEETKHQIRVIFGNGLRPQIWQQFQERFKISKIVELYGATEGTANSINAFGKVGAVGILSRLIPSLCPTQLIRINPETGEPLRGNDGLCIRCKPGEPGEAVGIINRYTPTLKFDGYVNTAETRKKIVTDCFSKGDMAFLSGDMLVMDEEGYLYFVDRMGDTFRFRGENVSTNEVEAIISNALDLPCAVYGVEIPGVEGRAGMAAIQCDRLPNVEVLYEKFKTSLPTYAVPIFLRICQSMAYTGTYKLRKVELKKEGYDPVAINDPLYFLDPVACSYVKLDAQTHEKIKNGELRL